MFYVPISICMIAQSEIKLLLLLLSLWDPEVWEFHEFFTELVYGE